MLQGSYWVGALQPQAQEDPAEGGCAGSALGDPDGAAQEKGAPLPSLGAGSKAASLPSATGTSPPSFPCSQWGWWVLPSLMQALVTAAQAWP